MWKFWVSDFWTGLEDVRVVGSRSMTSKMLHIKLFLMDSELQRWLVGIVQREFFQQKTMSTSKRNKYRIGGDGGEQSKMILKQGKVLLYSSTFFRRKVWNEAWAVLHADSQLYVYKDSRCVKEHFQVLLETSALMIAFGAGCRKYQPSNFSQRGCGDRFNENCLIAIPTVDRNVHVHWLAATSESDLRSWLHCIAKTVEGRVLPPKLGKRPVAMQIVEELRATGRITNDPLRWEAYWLATMPDQFSNDAPMLNGQSKMNPYLEPTKLTRLVYTANCNLIETPVASQSKHQSMNLNQLKHHTFSYSGHEKFIS
ncbi:hypothetical protein T03_15326 [Trichinella britovi]|uniref:PH domain-containing protein n=1 Tax=Trichinella britovi TaxID=45882 RepID=A0A0V1D988_TRIBR|nr:hypothetical protein T03_15326 [Trichinella britovi]